MKQFKDIFDAFSWDDVQEYLVLANARSPDFRFRLPTEEEWEYACRAGSSLALSPPHGKTRELEMALLKHQQGDVDFLTRYASRFAWIQQTQPQSTGMLQPNAWGLHDMHGNVWEWCDGGDPAAEHHPIRGGAWSTTDVFGCRAALRDFAPRDTRKDSFGFRLLAEPR